MKKIKVVFLLLLVAFVATGCNKGMQSNIDDLQNEPAGDSEPKPVVWKEGTTKAYVPKKGGVWYPRMLLLKNGDILCSFDTNEDGGRTKVKIIRSQDGGVTWSEPIVAAERANGDCANGQMIQLENGDIWIAYRVVNNADGNLYTSLEMSTSTDGVNFSVNKDALIAKESSKGSGGVWEPHLGFIGDKIVVMYANDNVSSSSSQQNLIMKVWEDSGWVQEIIVSDGVKANSRDGMPVFDRLKDGRYIVVFEATDLPGYPFVLKYKISDDGFDWSGERLFMYKPIKAGRKIGAPFVIVRDDGIVLVAFQTDEDTVGVGDAFSYMKVLTFDPETKETSNKTSLVTVNSDSNANWNCMLDMGDKGVLAASSVNGSMGSSIMIKRGQ